MKDVPAYFMDLNFNGSLYLDPKQIGTFPWPVDTKLAAYINRDLTDIFFKLIIEDQYAPYNKILRSLYSLTGTITYMIYNNALIEHVRQYEKDKDAFIIDKTKPALFLSFFDIFKDWGNPSVKDYITIYGQKYLFKALSVLGVKLNIRIQNNSLYDKNFRYIYRIRNLRGIFKTLPVQITKEEHSGLENLKNILLKDIERLARTYNVHLNEPIFKAIDDEISLIFKRRYGEYKQVQAFMSGMQFNIYDQSMTTYAQALLGVVAVENGGKGYSSFHGSSLSSDEPDIASMGNSSIFCALNDAMVKDAEELRSRLPAPLSSFLIKNLGINDFFKQNLTNEKPVDTIKHVAIMGTCIIRRASAFNCLDTSFYIDCEKRLSDLLLSKGYKVTYKAHPECTWRHFDKIFDPRVNIEWGPFNKVKHNYDAAFFHFSASSTLAEALGTGIHIYILKDGWHDKRSWPTRTQALLDKYANPVYGEIAEDGFIKWDGQQVIGAFEKPKSFDVESRVKDWFNRII